LLEQIGTKIYMYFI